MKKKRLNLAQMRITSFVTTVKVKEQRVMKGGVSVQNPCTENYCDSINSACPSWPPCDPDTEL